MRKLIGNIFVYSGFLSLLIYLAAYAAEAFGYLSLGLVDSARYVHGYIPAVGSYIPEFTPLAAPMICWTMFGAWLKGEM